MPDRQRAVAEQRVVEVAEAERVAEAAPLVRPQLEQEDLAEEVHSWYVGVYVYRSTSARAFDSLERRLLDEEVASPRRRVSSPRCIRMSRMIRQARQIASVCRSSQKRGASSKPCSRIICSEYIPQPSTNSGASVVSLTSDGWRLATLELEVVARVGLVDARVADRAPVVLAHGARVVVHGGGDDVDARRARVELRRLEVRGERDDVAQVVGRRDDLEALVVGHRHDAVLDEVGTGPGDGGPVLAERLCERRGMVRLHPVDDRRLVRGRVDLARGAGAPLAVEPQLLLADREDRVRVEAVEGPEARRARRTARCRAPTRRSRRAAWSGSTRRTPRRRGSPARPRHRDGGPRARRGSRSPAATISENRPGMSSAARISSSCQSRTGVAVSCDRLAARKPGTASRRSVIDARRSGSGAKSRAKMRKRASPTVSIAVQRRSQTRWTSRSKTDRRTLWTSSSRSKRTEGERPSSSSASIAGEMGPLRRDLADDRVARSVREAVVARVDAHVRRHLRMRLAQAAEARVHEVPEALVERAGIGGGRGPGEDRLCHGFPLDVATVGGCVVREGTVRAPEGLSATGLGGGPAVSSGASESLDGRRRSRAGGLREGLAAGRHVASTSSAVIP